MNMQSAESDGNITLLPKGLLIVLAGINTFDADWCLQTRGGTGSGMSEWTPAVFCVFLLDLDLNLESKICEKMDPESLFNLKTCWTQIQKFWNRSRVRVRVWKSDSGHLYCPCNPDEVFCVWSGCRNKLNWNWTMDIICSNALGADWRLVI